MSLKPVLSKIIVVFLFRSEASHTFLFQLFLKSSSIVAADFSPLFQIADYFFSLLRSVASAKEIDHVRHVVGKFPMGCFLSGLRVRTNGGYRYSAISCFHFLGQVRKYFREPFFVDGHFGWHSPLLISPVM